MKLKFFTSLALLCMAGAGALAQTTQTATKYSVEMNSETADADKWTAKVGSDDAQALPVEAAEGDAITAIYSGTKTVKSVKAVKKDDAIDLSKVTEDLTLQDGDVVTGTLNADVKISIAPGATVTLRNVNITAGTNNFSYQWAGLSCIGNATIILADGTTNTVKGFYEKYPGIHVPKNYTLTIQGTGALNASSNGAGCGIGGGSDISAGNIVIEGGSITAAGGAKAAGIGSGAYTSCGAITISGGTVIATGALSSAGIGSGYAGGCGAITISGGSVNAAGGLNSSGIGSGNEAGCGNITISGGTVEAMGGMNSAGIGSGRYSSCSSITITNTVTSVKATKGFNAPNSIGAGDGGSCGTVTIGGEVVGAITESPYTYTPGVIIVDVI